MSGTRALVVALVATLSLASLYSFCFGGDVTQAERSSVSDVGAVKQQLDRSTNTTNVKKFIRISSLQ
ncbi:hypothetical protein EJ06DRAFT_527336 [Trichodelitschia bisporula]|uniref:Uncharacterized protein n=1 Tax=Trichodelitschia bisporula TaxID=703511 RepID=A0A6G1I643_9PEZI|nr:hypothetical protein EJ06DRAFT_527336 [Trichodelitschia bisporula]